MWLAQPTGYGTSVGQVVLSRIRKQAEQAEEQASRQRPSMASVLTTLLLVMVCTTATGTMPGIVLWSPHAYIFLNTLTHVHHTHTCTQTHMHAQKYTPTQTHTHFRSQLKR